MSARTSGSSGRPPEPITSCTGDGSSSTIELTAPLPAARWRPIIPASPRTSERPSTAARPTWSVTGSSIRDAFGRRPASSASNWCSRMLHSSGLRRCDTSIRLPAAETARGAGTRRPVQARVPERAAAAAVPRCQQVEVAAELLLEHQPAELAVLLRDRRDHVGHGHRRRAPRRRGTPRWWRPSGCCRRPARTSRRRTSTSTSSATGSGGAEALPPQGRAQVGRRGREVDDRVEPAGERLVDVGPEVGGEDREPVEGLEPLEQVGALDVGVPVVGVAHLAPLAEDGVRLVEEQHRVDPAGLGEDPLEVLLGLPDVLVDDRGQVDRVQVQPEVGGDHLGGHGLAGAGVAGEQRGHAAAAAAALAHPPVDEHLVAVPGPGGQLLERPAYAGCQHQVVPGHLGLDPAGQPLQPGGVLGADAAAQVVGGDPAAVEQGRRLGGVDGALHLRRAEGEVGAEGVRVDVGADSLEVVAQQRDPLARPEHRRLDGQRWRRRPPGVPRRGAEEQHGRRPPAQPLHRLRVVLGQVLDGPGHQAGVAQQRLAGAGQRPAPAGRDRGPAGDRSTTTASRPVACRAATAVAAAGPALPLPDVHHAAPRRAARGRAGRPSGLG